MYLVDPRISSDPHDLLSIHTSTYLFFARRKSAGGLAA